MNQKCRKCNEIKKVSSFYRDRQNPCGRKYECKACFFILRNNLRNPRLPENHFKAIYKDSVRRVEKKIRHYADRTHSLTWEQWLTFYPAYLEVHKVWAENGYNRKFSPSIDRIDNTKGYHYDNVQVITMSSNTSKDQRGEKHNLAKLTEADVKDIRLKYISRECSNKELSEKYKVKGPTISDIVSRKIWKHVL